MNKLPPLTSGNRKFDSKARELNSKYNTFAVIKNGVDYRFSFYQQAVKYSENLSDCAYSVCVYGVKKNGELVLIL